MGLGVSGSLRGRVPVSHHPLGVPACPQPNPDTKPTTPSSAGWGPSRGFPCPQTPPPTLPTPLTDEPTSPSIDLKAKHVPASSVVSSAMNSAPAVATSPASPTFAFALSRHYSQDCSKCWGGGAALGAWERGSPLPQSAEQGGFRPLPTAGSIKAGRRSSYLLAITTERSKSCDDGLNAFRDEGKILR